jgi:hypothetical protein
MALPTPDGVVALDLDLSTLPDEAGIYWLQRETGALPDNHLLVQLMRSAMLGSIGRSPTSDELPTLLAWQRQLMMRGGRAINHLLIGPGMHGQGSDWSSCYVNPASFHEVTNLAGFSYDTVKQSMERVDYGTSLPDVLRAQLALDATGALCIETDVSKVFLVTASSDAGACAPNLEVDTARLQLVGSALGPITYEELEAKISDGSAPEIASKLNTSVLAVIVQSLASKSGCSRYVTIASSSAIGVMTCAPDSTKLYRSMTVLPSLSPDAIEDSNDARVGRTKPSTATRISLGWKKLSFPRGSGSDWPGLPWKSAFEKPSEHRLLSTKKTVMVVVVAAGGAAVAAAVPAAAAPGGCGGGGSGGGGGGSGGGGGGGCS